ncbi:hypothetical protein DMA11_04490 [Marinilabiliaceae bacterium JC017]|nr:hypothetical protein DMA11_04490 [Marinilabiliaceae bacterium JC017]
MSTYKLLLILLFLSMPSFWGLHAQEQQDTIPAWDNSAVDYRKPAADTITYYKQLPRYQYDLANDSESFWSRLWRFLGRLLMGTGQHMSVIGYILLGLAILSLLVFIIRLSGMPIKGLFMFSRSTPVTDISFSGDNYEIENANLDKQLELYIANGAFREATRVLFILCLRSLNNMNLINWKPWKTDREYYYEIKNKDHKQVFRQLILRYEYIWYGQFQVNDQEFYAIKAMFDHFSSDLKNRN